MAAQHKETVGVCQFINLLNARIDGAYYVGRRRNSSLGDRGITMAHIYGNDSSRRIDSGDDAFGDVKTDQEKHSVVQRNSRFGTTSRDALSSRENNNDSMKVG